MVFNNREQVLFLDESAFKVCDGSEFYPEDAEEAITQDCPMECGNGGVVSSCFVDLDHAEECCKITLIIQILE
jgi:hypothetical protein